MYHMTNIRFCYHISNDKLNTEKIKMGVCQKMFYVSEIKTKAPLQFQTSLQERVYEVLEELMIPFERVDTDEAITMSDCAAIDEKLKMHMVKTLFLSNRKRTQFYLFITKGVKAFCSKEFSRALGTTRVSFAPAKDMERMLGTKIGAATIFSSLLDVHHDVQVVLDSDVLSEEWYGCSDGTTTSFMRVRTSDIVQKFLPYTKHTAAVIKL